MPTMTIVEILQQEKQQDRKRVETVIVQIEGILATLRLWAKDIGSTGQPKRTILEMSVEVLKAHGKPMHSKAIAAAIMEKFGELPKTASVGSMIQRCIEKKGKNCVFQKMPGDTNTYGLKEWQK